MQSTAEIQTRAQRLLGEMLAQAPKATGGTPYKSTGSGLAPVETLASMGIDKKLSAVSQSPCRCAQAGSGAANATAGGIVLGNGGKSARRGPQTNK